MALFANVFTTRTLMQIIFIVMAAVIYEGYQLSL
jgi:hypothetical protein